MVRDLVRHAPEQEALRAGHALVADDDQVGLLLLGDVQDRVGGVALAREGLDLDAVLSRPRLAASASGGLDVLARADGVRDVRGDLLPLLAQPRLADTGS